MTRKAIPISIRKAVIERDGATCQKCGKVGTVTTRGGKPAVVEYTTERGRINDGSESISFHFHHIRPVFLRGTNDEENIELRCEGCNERESITKMVDKYIYNTNTIETEILQT